MKRRTPLSEMALTRGVTWTLFAAHAMSRWGDRMWEFAASLLLLSVWKSTSLLIVSALGLALSVSVVLFSVPIGAYVDATPRKQGEPPRPHFFPARAPASTVGFSVCV